MHNIFFKCTKRVKQFTLNIVINMKYEIVKIVTVLISWPCYIDKPKLCHKKMSLVDSDITVTFTRTKDRRQAIQRENLTFTFQSGLDVNYSLLTFAVHILQ